MQTVLNFILREPDLPLFAAAIALCAFGCWTTMRLLHRVRRSAGPQRRIWLWASGAVFGGAIWSTHFIIVLAYPSALPVGFDLGPTLSSIAIAIVLSTAGFALAFKPGWNAAGAAFVGAAIASMHYVGMMALEGPFHISWDLGYVVASLVIGVGFSALAGWAAFAFRNIWGLRLAAAFFTLAICGLLFTGMSAETIIPDERVVYGHVVAARGLLALAVAAIAFLIVSLGFICALVDLHLMSRAAGEAARLRAHVAALETAQAELRETSARLRFALDEAAAASASKSQFLATMSHELRTPLNAVIGFSEFLRSEPFGPLGDTRYCDFVGDIHSSGIHLLELIDDILDLTQLDAGRMTLSETEMDVGDVAAEALRLVAEPARAGSVTLSAPSAPQALLVGDRRRVLQVLLNVLSNAVKFTLPGGHVSVEIAAGDTDLTIRIGDTGIGMAAEDIPKALERFGQVDSRLSRRHGGAGLGLSLAKHLAELHGGALTLESTLGVGTVVTLAFPAERRRHALPRAA